MQFRDFVGRYLIHCHNMGHEDDFMMVRWDIVDTKSELRCAQGRDTRTAHGGWVAERALRTEEAVTR